MLKFLKRLLQQPQPEQPHREPPSAMRYQDEFRRLTDEMWNRHHLEGTPYDDLLYSMASIEHEMNDVGGGNWNSGDYDECLETVVKILSSAPQFTPEQVVQVRRCADEIAACGRELLEQGSSGRGLTEEIDYLVARTVEWCQAHPRDTENDD